MVQFYSVARWWCTSLKVRAIANRLYITMIEYDMEMLLLLHVHLNPSPST
jgi:hypothetical protein